MLLKHTKYNKPSFKNSYILIQQNLFFVLTFAEENMIWNFGKEILVPRQFGLNKTKL